MNRIEQAQKEGCMHCFKTSLTLVNDNKLICDSCGCIHTSDGYSYSVSIHAFERDKEAHWGTYAEYAKEEAVDTPATSSGGGMKK